MLAALGSQLLARYPGWLGAMLDEANHRSLHAGAIPRTGGLALLLGILVALAFALALGAWPGAAGDPGASTGFGAWLWILVALLPVAVISLLDDRGGVRPRYRLVAHLTAGGILVVGGLGWVHLELPGLTLVLGPVFTLPLTLLLVVWMTNLYNFMDGMDGLAGGMAVFGFGALAVLGWRGGDPSYALACANIAMAAAGFLTANFPPARLFLGDLGSTSLGLLAVALALFGNARGLFPLWVAGLAFSPFILDATATLIRRAFRGERLWEAHRSHHYQRLVLAGWSQQRVMIRAWLLMAACAVCAVVAPGLPTADQWLLLAAWGGIFAATGYRVRLAERLAQAPEAWRGP